MTKSKLLTQIIIATTITILTVATITTATTIGTNISTSGTLTVTGATTLNGGLTMDTNKFTVADTSGNTSIAGTLGVTGVTTLVNASSTLLTNSGQSWLNGNVNINGMATTTASSGNIATEGTLSVTGVTSLTGQLNLVNASSTGWFKINTINSDTGTTSVLTDLVLYEGSTSTPTTYFFNNRDPIGVGETGQGFIINDDGGNLSLLYVHVPSFSLFGGIPFNTLSIKNNIGGHSQIAIDDSDGNAAISLPEFREYRFQTIFIPSLTESQVKKHKEYILSFQDAEGFLLI